MTFTIGYDPTPYLGISPDTGMPAAWSRAAFTWRDTGRTSRCAGDYLDADPFPRLGCGLETAAVDLGFNVCLIRELYKYTSVITRQLRHAPRARVECPLGVLTIELNAMLAAAETADRDWLPPPYTVVENP